MKSLQAFGKILKALESQFDIAPTPDRMVRRFLPHSKILILSPHPDDEILSRWTRLRLQLENSCQVINVAATLGSNGSRKKARRAELAKALKFLKWDGYVLSENWREKETKLTDLLKRLQPALVIAPHLADHHPTHVRTSQMLTRALAKSRSNTMVAWAEYWNPQPNPNLMIGLSHDTLMKQIHALALHKGEVARNPYHLLLPAWQMDTVRRGSEWMDGAGALGAPFLYGQLYRLEKWSQGKKLRAGFLPAVRGLNADLSELVAR